MSYASLADCVTIYLAGGCMPIVFDNRFARKFPEITTRQPIKPDGEVNLRWLNRSLWAKVLKVYKLFLKISAKIK